MSKVIVREFNPETDSAAIFSSWPNGVYYSSLTDINEPKKEWYAKFFTYVKNQLAYSQVSIACMNDDPNTILGSA